jgi:hypothetical protein
MMLLHPSSPSARGIKYRVFILSNVVLAAANETAQRRVANGAGMKLERHRRVRWSKSSLGGISGSNRL